MNKTKLILFAASVSTVIFGCARGSLLDSDMSQADALLSIDKEAIEVEAASFHEGETISESFIVTASRSWSMASVPEVSWLSLSQTSGMNLGKVKKEWPISLTFEDNTASQERSLDLSITIDGKRVLVPVLQKAFSPVLTLESSASHNLPEVGGEVTLNVRSNSIWTAKVDESSSAKVTFKNGEKSDQREKSDTLTLVVKANTDTQGGKEATIILSTDGAEDVTVNLTQDICIPRLTIDPELSETDVLPGGGSYEVVFETNENWTATVDDDGIANGVTLSIQEGAPADQLFVNFPTATLEGTMAAVTITTTSGLSESLTFTQKGCILISFREWPDLGGYSQTFQPWTIVETGKKSLPRQDSDAGAGTWNMKDSQGRGYVLWTGNTVGQSMFHSEACGLTVGSIVDNPAFYIEFPAIEGKTLRAVKLMLGNSDVGFKDGTKKEATATGTKSWITDAEGNTVEGGEPQQVRTYQKDEDWNSTQTIPSFKSDYNNHSESMFYFTLTGTQPNTAYRYTGDYRQVIRWFILYYE